MNSPLLYAFLNKYFFETCYFLIFKKSLNLRLANKFHSLYLYEIAEVHLEKSNVKSVGKCQVDDTVILDALNETLMQT